MNIYRLIYENGDSPSISLIEGTKHEIIGYIISNEIYIHKNNIDEMLVYRYYLQAFSMYMENIHSYVPEYRSYKGRYTLINENKIRHIIRY